MSLKSSLLALAENIGMCQENARSIKQALAGGLADAAESDLYHEIQIVEADGVKTYSALLDELYDKAHASTGKILKLSGAGNIEFYSYPTRYSATSVEFEELRIRASGIQAHGFVVKETGSEYYTTNDGTVSNASASIPSLGTKFTLYD